MSTPVDPGTPNFGGTKTTRQPAKSDKELQQQMQDLVNLQSEQQQYAAKAPPVELPAMGSRGMREAARWDKKSPVPDISLDMAKLREVAVSESKDTSYSNLYDFDVEPGVGKGVLLTQNLETKQALAATPSLISSRSSLSPSQQQQQLQSDSSSRPPYGAISYSSGASGPSPVPTNPIVTQPGRQLQQPGAESQELATNHQPLQSISTMPSMDQYHDYEDRTANMAPDFQYTNPDNYNAQLGQALEGFDPDATFDPQPSSCCCLFDPFARCLIWLIKAEHLHRLFCTSAIDGLLTGSGLLAGLWGLQVATASSPRDTVRLWIVALTGATCSAEAICIGLSHIWNAHIEATALAWERTEARIKLSRQKADAKGSLVDVLLQRGMLKIDAMSLADTLEGYPDLFVAAMTGESWTTPLQDASPAPSLAHIRNIASYSLLSEQSDPEHHVMRESMSQAKSECCFMSTGFALFALVPSLVFWLLPVEEGHAALLLSKSATTQQHHPYLSDAINNESSSTTANGGTTNPVTIVMLATCLVTWCLGLWKSRFYHSYDDHNSWSLLFSLEPVLILLVCISVSVSAGLLLGFFMLPTLLELQEL